VTRNGWAVYLVRCCDGSFDSGITNDLNRRLRQHSAGTALRYTRNQRPVSPVCQEAAADRSAALKREAAIKKLSRREKLSLVRRLG